MIASSSRCVFLNDQDGTVASTCATKNSGDHRPLCYCIPPSDPGAPGLGSGTLRPVGAPFHNLLELYLLHPAYVAATAAAYAGWYDGGYNYFFEHADTTVGAPFSCSEACPLVHRKLPDGNTDGLGRSLGLICSDGMLQAHMHEVDSCAKMEAAMLRVAGLVSSDF
jgi:hypothetical protein